ncbi:hypothetical protein NDU88_006927 [Pleurodeles waltl]|uniref:Uncharacterized protein n=1 Tax=Pleurodeles waltl TaxID=8319 RepID=A0AAV7SR26_PLEWA|nr:hypothetical protein NDU88_006927 [Pleurodeles waltl]
MPLPAPGKTRGLKIRLTDLVAQGRTGALCQARAGEDQSKRAPDSVPGAMSAEASAPGARAGTCFWCITAAARPEEERGAVSQQRQSDHEDTSQAAEPH